MAAIDNFNKEPLVSVIVNCFNGEKYLDDCLNSIIFQSYKNWELIFWDNQSTDNSKKIFNKFKDERFKYFLSPRHTYLYEARDLAIQKSKGEYFAFCDVDDYWSNKKLEILLPLFKNDKIGIVYSNQWMLNDKDKKKRKRINYLLPRGDISKRIIFEQPITINTAIIKKSLYLSLKEGFNKKFQIIGDYDFLVRVSKKCLFDCVQEPLTFYRLHEDNFTKKNRETEVKELEDWIKEIQNIDHLLSNKELKLINELILYKKTIILILKKEKLKSLTHILKFPNNFKKLKLFLALLMPEAILRKIKEF